MAIFIRERKIATFNGIHNASKTKTLLTLYSIKHKYNSNKGLSARGIHLASGVNLAYLNARLGLWYDWGYIYRRAQDTHQGRPIFVYMIAPRGEHFVEDIVPDDARERYLKEIRAYRLRAAKHS